SLPMTAKQGALPLREPAGHPQPLIAAIEVRQRSSPSACPHQEGRLAPAFPHQSLPLSPQAPVLSQALLLSQTLQLSQALLLSSEQGAARTQGGRSKLPPRAVFFP